MYIQLQTPNFALLHQASFMVTQVMKSTIQPDLTVSQNGHKMYLCSTGSTDPNILATQRDLISWIKMFHHFPVGGSIHLKNISQIGPFPQVGVKIKHIWNHHPVFLGKNTFFS